MCHGCSTCQSRKSTAGAIGTSSCNVRTKGAIPGQRSSAIPAGSTGSPSREAQLEHVSSERDPHFVSKKDYLRACVCSAGKQQTGNPEWSVKRNKHEHANLHKQHEGTEVHEAMDRHFQVQWRLAEAQLRDTHEPNNAQVQQLAASLQRSELEQIGGANPQNVTRYGTPSSEHGTPERERWKQLMSQAATCQAETHALQTSR